MQLIAWENIDDYVKKGIPAQLPISTQSRISFLIGSNGRTLGLRLPSVKAAEVTTSPYRELDISVKMIQEESVVELTVTQENLFKTFYNFSIGLVQEILFNGVGAEQAIEHSLENWASLLIQRKLLEETVQIGLAGELCFLRALIEEKGPDAFDSWLGPIGEPHDFRLASKEVEVKSTRNTKRIHTIHGLGQLEPSDGMELFLLSLQFEPAGKARAGKSLVERIEEIRSLLVNAEGCLKKFETYLKKLGYTDSDSSFYSEKFKLRNSPMLIWVNSEFPRLTRSIVAQVLPNGTSHRLTHVEYELDVEGLGYLEGSVEFSQILNGIGRLENSND